MLREAHVLMRRARTTRPAEKLTLLGRERAAAAADGHPDNG
jgi:hypothetical protein